MELETILRDVRGFLAASSSGLGTWSRLKQAESWPSTAGTVWQAEACPVEGMSHIKPWVAEITYSYSVNGEYYSGFHEIETLTERGAENLAEGWRGRSVVVRYCPSNPKISALVRNDQPAHDIGN